VLINETLAEGEKFNPSKKHRTVHVTETVACDLERITYLGISQSDVRPKEGSCAAETVPGLEERSGKVGICDRGAAFLREELPPRKKSLLKNGRGNRNGPDGRGKTVSRAPLVKPNRAMKDETPPKKKALRSQNAKSVFGELANSVKGCRGNWVNHLTERRTIFAGLGSGISMGYR